MPLPLRLHDAGQLVQDLRTRLAHWQRANDSTDILDITPDFDEATLEVVRQFMRSRFLGDDGIVTQEVWNALVGSQFKLGDRNLWLTSTPLQGDDIFELQRLLTEFGIQTPVDGIFSQHVHESVKQFQRIHQLKADGNVGEHTVAMLLANDRDHLKQRATAQRREGQMFRYQARGGITGLSIVLDPSSNNVPLTPKAEITRLTWDITNKLAGRLRILGANVVMTRGPHGDPKVAQRVALANTTDSTLLISVSLSGCEDGQVHGSNAYFYRSPLASAPFDSPVGHWLATQLSASIAEHDNATGLPGGKHLVHGASWEILRGTRMPAIIVEPAYVTHPLSLARINDEGWQHDIVDVMACTIGASLAGFEEHYTSVVMRS